MWNFFKAPRAPQGRKDTPLVQYRIGRRFDPGAPAEVFERVLTDPLYLSTGAGVIAGAMRIFQHPQVAVTPVIGVNGLGGVQAGQILGQPLIDPAELDNTGGE